MWLGIPCSTFVWMSSSRHKRTPTAPFGNPKYTKKANILVLRAMFLAIVATLRGVYVGIEQPSSSMLMYVPHLRMLAALAGMNWRHVKTHLACWRTLLMFRCKTARIFGGIQFVLCLISTSHSPNLLPQVDGAIWPLECKTLVSLRYIVPSPQQESAHVRVCVRVCVCVSAVRI